MYIVKNEKEKVFEAVGSLATVSKMIGIKPASIYHQFSRNKKTVCKFGDWEIEKKELIIGRRL